MSKMRISREWLRNVVLLAAATSLCGCATIVNGTKQTITINTEPAGATARLRGQVVKTPGKVIVQRSKLNTITLSHDGYKTKRVNLGREMSAWVWGNIPLCGVLLAPVGMAVDSFTGGGFVQIPSDVGLALVALPAGGRDEPPLTPLPSVSKEALFRPLNDLTKVRICILGNYLMGSDWDLEITRILDNDDAVGLPKSHTFLCWERKPGPVTVSVSDGDRQFSLELKAKGGQTYFIEQSLTSLLFGSFQLTVIDPNKAQLLLQKYEPVQRSRYIQYQ